MNIIVWWLLDKLQTNDIRVKEEEKENDSFKDLSWFLKSSHSVSFPSVFSSDNNLLSCYTYGDDIYDLIETVKQVADLLLLDKKMSHELIYSKRKLTFIRLLFIGKDGSFPDVTETLTELRLHSLRLSEALELRSKNTNLGIHTFKNIATATQVFNDLDTFYTEIFHGYRKYQPDTRATISRRRR